MSLILEQLLVNQTRRDEKANVALAEKIVREKDSAAVAEVFSHLSNKKLESDCIKILYEIAEKSPELAVDYADYFVELLNHKNNRIVWGAMTAIDAITGLKSDLVFAQLDTLQAITDKGSVITRDHFVNILIKLAPTKSDVFPILHEQFANCPPNQLPMYAERSLAVLSKENSAEFVEIITNRLSEMATESKKKRLEKIIKKLK